MTSEIIPQFAEEIVEVAEGGEMVRKEGGRREGKAEGGQEEGKEGGKGGGRREGDRERRK